MTTPSLVTKPFLVPAGGTVQINRVGTLVFCLTSTGTAGDLKLRFGNGGTNRFDAGDKFRFKEEDTFDFFWLDNGSGSDITVTVVLGDGDVSISNAVSVTGTVATQEVKGGTITNFSDVTLNNGSVTLIVAANSSRREVVFKNLDTTNSFRTGSNASAAASGGELDPKQWITLTTKGAIYGYASVAGVKVCGFELAD